MGYKVYLVEQFKTTHENIFFRDFSDSLSKKFRNDDRDSVLVGNLSVRGHEIDALFIRSGQITIIEFKNYGGKLKFSENNPWFIQDEEQGSFVGNNDPYKRNPYGQVKKYRYELIEFLSKREKKVVSKNRDNLDWGHISGIVLFHKPIDFNNNEIPYPPKTWFYISDFNNSVKLLEDIYSSKLNLSDVEISKIIKQLDVRDENLFNRSLIIEDKNDYEEKIKLDLLKRLVRDVPKDADKTEKILHYYRIILEIESYREKNDLKKLYPIPLNSSLLDCKEEQIAVDFTKNNIVLKELSNNRNERFPKNIFIGIVFKVGEKKERKVLLYQVLLASDINYHDSKNIIKAKNFELYSPSLRDLDMQDNLIEEISNSISNLSSIQKKVNLLKKELDTLDLKVEEGLAVSLSNKNLFNSQLSSELNRLIKHNLEDLQNGLINSYLNAEPIKNEVEEYPELINITPLNNYQKVAVKASFENCLSVITGPPGTGKTQLVLNLIANSIVSNKKILFASKNNKAVDNVIERFISDYLLRIGSKEIIESKLKPKLESFIKKNYQYKEGKESYKKKLDKIQVRTNEISDIFIRKEELPSEIEDHKNKLEEVKTEFEKYINSIDRIERKLFFDNNYDFELSSNSMNLILNKLLRKRFIGRFLFETFFKSRIIEKIVNIENGVRSEIINHINSIKPLFVDGQSSLDLIIDHIKEFTKLHKNYLEHKSIKNNNIKITQDEQNLLENKKEELSWIIKNESLLEKEFKKLQSDYIENSINYLNLCINNKLREVNPSVITNYRSYLCKPPWKDEEYRKYEKICKAFLDKFLSFSVTNLSVKNALSLSKKLFDILVIDEASQCDIASAIPLIFRAKKVVVIGDPYQLKHITSVKKQYEENYILNHLGLSETDYNYENNSLFDYVKNLVDKSNIPTYFLREHFRCHPDIIKFSNNYFYDDELIIKTKDEQYVFGSKGIVWCDIKGETSNNRNYNEIEKQYVLELVQKLMKKYPKAEIGITTPFLHQKEELKNKENILRNIGIRPEIDTIHGFQGDEKDIIVLSLVVTDKAKDSLTKFINIYAEYLLNVAVTRARSTLYIVGDFEFCKNNKRNENKALSRLAQYVELNGTIIRN